MEPEQSVGHEIWEKNILYKVLFVKIEFAFYKIILIVFVFVLIFIIVYY